MNTTTGRVLHFIDSGGIYGAENVLLNLSREMQKAGNFLPIVGCIVSHPEEPSDLFDQANDMGIPAKKIVIRNSMLLLDLWRAARSIKAAGVQLIHSHGYKPSVFGFVLKQLTGIEVMATCHLWFKGAGRPLKMRTMIWLELICYRKFPAVVGVSVPIRKTLEAAGVPARVLSVVQNGVDTDSLGVKDLVRSEALKSELGIEPDDTIIINTGRLTQQKGQAVIVSAAALLASRGIRCRFLIVGEGELRDQLQAQISAEGVEDSVELLGFRDCVADLLAISDLYILPSYDEGMPMGLLEAAAAGVPVIATPVGDIPTLVSMDVSGLLVPPGDAEALVAGISKLLHDPKLCETFKRKARQLVEENYSCSIMYEIYAEIYSRLLPPISVDAVRGDGSGLP